MINYDTGEYTNKSTGEHYSVTYMILEYAEGGDLFNYVQTTGRFSEKLARHFFLQILNAIKYSHDKNICHRDLKLENIMLDKDYNIKLIDFGFQSTANGIDGTGFHQTNLGTKGYMAPELV